MPLGYGGLGSIVFLYYVLICLVILFIAWVAVRVMRIGQKKDIGNQKYQKVIIGIIFCILILMLLKYLGF